MLTQWAVGHHATDHPHGTLLAEVQAAIREDRPPAEAATADGTIQVHACRGPPRQLAELVDRLDEVLTHPQGSQSVRAWVDALTGALELLTATSDADAWQLAQARRELAEAAEYGDDAASCVKLVVVSRPRGRR